MLHEITTIGYVGRDPELRSTQSGKSFYTFSLGVSVGTKDKPKTEWLDVTANHDHPAMTYVKKGTKMFLRGKPSTRVVKPKNGGEPYATQCVWANTIELLSSKSDSKPQAEATYEPMSMPTAGGGLQSDDIPF